MKLTVGEMSALCGVSARTLRYYDEKHILSPVQISPSGYRLYDEHSVERLQEIQFFKALGFSLCEIFNILSDPVYCKRDALTEHRELLYLQFKRTEALIKILDEILEGKEMNSFNTLMDTGAANARYHKEAKERWGNTAQFAESEKRQVSMTAERKLIARHEMDDIFSCFARVRSADPKSAAEIVKRWQNHITEYWYTCSDEILNSLADMYISDERFKNNIDSFGEGTAQFMHDAIKAYCK